MAITWGGYVTYNGYNFFRVGVEGSVSSTDTETTITARTYIQLASGSSEGFWNFRGRTNAGGGYSGWASGGDTYVQDTTARQISSATYKKARTTSAQTVTVYGQGYDAYLGTGTGTASQNVTVPALASYAVTYNANGGSGAPSSQTKYYGVNLALSSAKPTRTNYNFKGWATSSTATTATYQPGATYSGNAALALYAVWELAYVAPTITSLKAYRSDSSGNASDESTTHVTFELGWSFNQTGGTNTSGTAAFTWADSKGSRSATGVALSGQTGTVKKTYAATSGYSYLDTKSYPVSVTVTDAHNLKATKASSVPVVFAPLMARSQGHSVGILGIAPAVTPSGGVYPNLLSIFGEVREYAVADGYPYNRRFASNLSSQVGSDVPSANTVMASSAYYDKNGANCYYSQLVKTSADDLYHSYAVTRKKSDGSTSQGAGLYIHDPADGEAYLSFAGTNMVRNTKNEMQVGGYYAIVTGKSLAKGAAIGTYADVYRYRLFLIKLGSGDNNWCLGYRFGGSMGRDVTTASEHYIRGVGGYNTGTATYLFTSVIKVGANGALTHVVSAQHLQAASANTGTDLNFQALYGIA